MLTYQPLSLWKMQEVAPLLDKVEFVIVPFANPDGYAVSWSEGRVLRAIRKVV